MQIKREQIVSNGCSGGCCEKFTLPVSLEDIEKMLDAYKHNESIGYNVKKSYSFEEREKFFNAEVKPIERIICYNGIERGMPPLLELQKLKDMLIPLGETEENPQLGDKFNKHFIELLKNQANDRNLYDFGGHYKIHYESINIKVTSQIFTCKHFDKVNKICTNYENRPQLCKDFGKQCKYSGCGYADKYAKEFKSKTLTMLNTEKNIGDTNN